MTTPKKLIGVALPLEAINIASAREKSILHGHPSTLHLWWARRPLAAARAVIFSQMVDDPSYNPDPTKGTAKRACFDRSANLCYFHSDSTRHASIERCAHPCGSFYLYTP